MKILTSQIRDILSGILSSTDRAHWDAAYDHSLVSGNSTIHHTHANFTTLASYTNSNASISAAIVASHSHTNLALLEQYTQSESSLATAVSQSHMHSNKSLLDTLTGFTNASLLTTISNQHLHSNKALLDTLTGFTNANLLTTISNQHTHANISILNAITESFTTSLKANYDLAYTNTHTHSNSSALNNLVQSVIDNSHTHSNKALLDSLTSSGSGTLYLTNDGTYKAVSGGGAIIGGSNTQVLFNDSGTINGNASLIFDKTTGLTSMLQGLVSQALYFSNSSVYIKKDTSNNLIFTDLFNTDVTLSSLLAGSTIPNNPTGDDIILGRDSTNNWILFTLDDLAAATPTDNFVKWDDVNNYYRFYLDKAEAGGASSDGKFYLGTSNPDSDTRLNYDGLFYASYIEGIAGVFGNGVDSSGVRGNSINAAGVYGVSTNTYGVWGDSTDTTGICGSSTSGKAALFTVGTTSTVGVEFNQVGTQSADLTSNFVKIYRNLNSSTNAYNVSGSCIYIEDTLTGSGTKSSSVLKYAVATGDARIDLNPRVVSGTTAVAYMFDTTTTLASTSKLLSLRNNNSERFSVLHDGSVNIPTGATYSINGVPINTGFTPISGLLEWNNSTYVYQPYATQQAVLSFDTSSNTPSLTDRLNLNGRLYTTGVISGNTASSLTAFSGYSNNASGGYFQTNTSHGCQGISLSTGTGVLGASKTGRGGWFSNDGTTTTSSNILQVSKTGSGSINLTGDLLYLEDNGTTSGTISGSAIKALVGVVTRINMNPRVANSGSNVAYTLDTHNNLTGSTKLLSLLNQGVEKAFIDKDGKYGFVSGSSSTITIVSGVLKDFYTTASTSGTGETDLYSYTVPSNVLATNGDKITAEYALAVPSAVHTIAVYFASTQIGTISYNNAADCKVTVAIIRTGASTARSVVSYIYDQNSVAADTTQITELTSKDWTTTNILKITGTAGANTVDAILGIIEYKPAAKN